MDNSLPNEMTFLQSGAFNLGFIGLSKTEETLHFLRWWKERLWHYCLSDVQKGLFVDQKWIDLVPSLFERVHILKEPAYNVAYWNLQEKTFAVGKDTLTVNGVPLYFFHFSGLDVDEMESISKYQTRYTLSDFKELRRLLNYIRNYYKERLLHGKRGHIPMVFLIMGKELKIWIGEPIGQWGRGLKNMGILFERNISEASMPI
jgi:hypothetical protein